MYADMRPVSRAMVIVTLLLWCSSLSMGLTVSDEVVTMDISDAGQEVSFWLKGEDAGNSRVEIVGEDGRRFRMYLGVYRLRFPSTVPSFTGYARYDSDMWTDPVEWHRITVNFTAGTVRSYRVGRGVQRYAGDLTRGNGTLDPRTLRLSTSGPDETMRFRASLNTSRRAVAPRSRPLMAVTAANVSYTISRQPVPGATNIGHAGPLGVPAAEWLASREPVDPVRVPDAPMAALRSVRHAIEHDRPVSFRRGERVDTAPLTNTSHLVLLDPAAPAAAVLMGHASSRRARLVPMDAEGPYGSRWELRKAVDAVTEEVSLEQRAEPLVLTVLGAPWFREEDPIEEALLAGSDEVDGKLYPTDAPYFDIDDDGWAELAYGRLPADPVVVRRMLGAGPPHNATVLAAYRTEDWVSTVRHNWAGMLSGHQLALDLMVQDKGVRLVVENRTGLRALRGVSMGAVSMLAGVPDPGSADAFIDAVVRGAVGNGSAMNAVRHSEQLAKAVAAVKAGQGAGQATDALTGYANLVGLIKSLRDVAVLFHGLFEYRFDPSIPSLRELTTPALQRDWDGLSLVVLGSLITHRPVLNTTTAERALSRPRMVVYSGRGNGTHWILPNRDGGLDLSGLVTDEELFNQYNGTNAVRPDRVRGTVIDLSGSSRGEDGLARTMLRAGASGYLGFSARTYTPFPGLLASEYVMNGLTAGSAFRSAFNSRAGLVALLNPANLVIESGFLGTLGEKSRKTRRSMFQFMPPMRRTDPPVRAGPRHIVDCGTGSCRHARWYNASQVRDRTRTVRALNGSVSVLRLSFTALDPSNITVGLRTDEGVPWSAFERPAYNVSVHDRITGGSTVRVVATAASRAGRVTGVWVNHTTPVRFRLRRAGPDGVRAVGDVVGRYGVMARNRTHGRWLGEARIGRTLSIEGLSSGRWELTAVAATDRGTVRDRLVIGRRDRYPVRAVGLLEPVRMVPPFPDGFGRNLAGPGAVPLRPGEHVVRLRDGSRVRLDVARRVAGTAPYELERLPVPTLRVPGRGLVARAGPHARSVMVNHSLHRYRIAWNRSGVYERYSTPTQVIELRGRPGAQDTIVQHRGLSMTAMRQLLVLYGGLYGGWMHEVNDE